MPNILHRWISQSPNTHHRAPAPLSSPYACCHPRPVRRRTQAASSPMSSSPVLWAAALDSGRLCAGAQPAAAC
jgi:hypothetical protein